MDKKRLTKISEDALIEEQFADDILSGESDNYDGADGARTVRRLCEYISELVETVKALQAQRDAVPIDALKRQYSVALMGTHDFELDAIDVDQWLRSLEQKP